MYDFLLDLDEYFCERYANYDKLCVLNGYRMPTMQATKTDDFGRTFAYTLPANTMRLALQEKKTELLQQLKEKIVDKGFSFSFRPVGLFRRRKYKRSKIAPKKLFLEILERNKLTQADLQNELTIDSEILDKIFKGNFAPTKNTIYSIALVGHLSIEETSALLIANGYEINYASEREVVISYLLENKVFARPMIEAAFAEYKVSNLFIK